MAGMYGCFKGRNSDSAAMASGPPDVMTNQEPAEVQEECSGKKKSKFQTFKKFFARKKKKEPSAAGADAGLKASQSSDNVSKTSENNTLTRSEKEKGSGSKISLGSKALSHDSVFVSDSSEANEALGASQDSIHGKVKSLQFQLKQAIRLGSPPSLMCVKKTDDAGTMSEDDGLPCSPPEYTTLHTAMNQAQRNSSISLEGIDSDDDQLSCAASSRAMSPLVVPGDFSQPASPFACLDNSAAKHKLGLRHKACNKRKPASRLEVKTEGDSVVDETLNASITEVLEEQQQRKIEAVSFDALKPKVKREEEEEEEEKEDEKEEEEKEQPQQSRQSLLRDKEEREEGEDESEAEQDVSQSPDTSSTPPEPSLPEEEAPEAQPLPSSEPSSRASSLDSPRVTPETPAGPKEYLLDPPGIAYGAEDNKGGSELALSGEEDEVQENKEEESSFLQEVLSSLKTPLASSSLGVDTEGVVLEMEETTGKEEEEKEEEEEEEAAEIEDGEEVKEEEAEVDEGVGYLAAPSASLVDHTTEEEEEESTPPCRDETLPNEEEAQSEEEEEEAEEEEEEELVVERFSQHDQAEEEAEEEEAKEVELEEINDTLARKTDLQEQKESQEGESEEAIELEKEPEVEEEGRGKREEEEEEEEEAKLVRGRLEEAEEATEEEKEEAEEVTETFHNAAEEEVGIAMSSQEAAEGADAVVGDDTVCTASQVSDDETPTKEEDQELDKEPEQEENCETVEEGAKVDHSVEKSEEDQPDVDESEVEQADVSCLDAKQVEKDETEATEQEQATVPSKLPSLSLPMPQHETQTQESGTVSPSKTTTIHINLVSPSSEKVTSFFPQPKTPAELQENVTESPSHEQQHLASAGEEQAEAVEQVEEEKQSAPVKDATPTPVEDMANQPSSSSDQSKARFTVTPASQRSQSLTPPSSPPAYVSSAITASGAEEVEAPSKKDPAVNTEPESSPKVELVLSPSRARNAGNAAAKPQSNASPSPSSAKPQTSAAASTEESSVVVEGNPDNPFGVRLRKTSALQRFSSEEENTESPTEPPVQPTSCKPEPPQPISIKPTVSQPTSSKPALPKKPDVHGDSGGKTKRISDAAAARGVSSGSDSPSWITVAKQKQKIYKENSLEEITVKKEEQERKSSLPMYVSSATSREQSNKTAESTSKASLSEINKAPVSVEKEARRALSPPAPVPPQPSKAPSLPCPVPPKPQVPPATTKPPPQPTPHHRSLSPPTPVPVPQKSPSCTSPPSLSKTAASLPSPKTAQPQSTTANSAPFSPRTAPEKPGSRPPGVSAQTPPSPRGLPPPALPQDEPPWMALAKKKAKAWSEMPQIVQ